MTVNELNSKIHLPSLAAHQGIGKDYSYIKLPRFGWFGYNHNLSHVFDVLQLLNADPYNIIDHYKFLVRDHPEFHEFRINYAEVSENKLCADYTRMWVHREFWMNSRHEAVRSNTRYRGKQVKVSTLLEDLGMAHLLSAGIGFISPRMVENSDYKIIKVKQSNAGQLLIPTYCAPDTHIASLELSSFENIEQRSLLYLNQEKGWYGILDKSIVSSFKELLTVIGCTWDPKIDYWTNKPVDLHKSLTVPQCIDIWTKATRLACKPSPLEVIKNNNEIDRLKDYVSGLTMNQVKELEAYTKDSQLLVHWTAAKNTQIEVCGLKITRKSNRYYIVKHGQEVEYTNFAIELTKIRKEEGEFYQYGIIYLNDTETPFRAKRKDFISHYTLMTMLYDVLLEAGVGIPTIAPNFKHYITNVIEAFNQGNIIEISNPAPRAQVVIASPQACGSHPVCMNEESLHSQTPALVNPDQVDPQLSSSLSQSLS